MTTEETSILLGILRVAYPRFYADISRKEAETIARTWAIMLSDTTLEVAQIALQRLLATNKFPPSIAEMRESIAAVKYPPLPDAGEAWGEVNNAIREYGYYRKDEAFASMREATRLAVQRMGWSELCQSENSMADRAHFLRIYEAMEKRTREEQQIPAKLKEAIAMLGQGVNGSVENTPLLVKANEVQIS